MKYDVKVDFVNIIYKIIRKLPSIPSFLSFKNNEVFNTLSGSLG